MLSTWSWGHRLGHGSCEGLSSQGISETSHPRACGRREKIRAHTGDEGFCKVTQSCSSHQASGTKMRPRASLGREEECPAPCQLGNEGNFYKSLRSLLGLLQGQFHYRVWGGAANLLGQCAMEGEDTGRQRSLSGTQKYSTLVQPVLSGEGRLESILDIPGKWLCGMETTAQSFTRSATSPSLLI